MTETQITSFLACAQLQSLSKASEQLFCAAQAISKNLLHLEKELNCRLFDRTPQGLVLTETGKEY
ncbi:MAG: LysR family transcriptional regulator [Eubacterium sp.]|nr:LysR family transcriptional regulator [Eubacterium sp.]